MSSAQPILSHPHLDSAVQHARSIGNFFAFLKHMQEVLKERRVPEYADEVQSIRDPIEHHYNDDQGKPAMYIQFESAMYDDAASLVTLWQVFQRYECDELRGYQRLIALERDGLINDRHPRKVFDRSPLGIAALIVGTITVWMSMLKTYSGENLDDLFALIRFNWLVGTMWIVGLFVVVWYILKTHRNNVQVAFLSTVSRALDVYLEQAPNDLESSLRSDS